jgi:hypothetical protein
VTTPAAGVSRLSSAPPDSSDSAEGPSHLEGELSHLEGELSHLEGELSHLEGELSHLERQLSPPDSSYSAQQKLKRAGKQIARPGPTLWIKIPIRELRFAQNLGQPCIVFVCGLEAVFHCLLLNFITRTAHSEAFIVRGTGYDVDHLHHCGPRLRGTLRARTKAPCGGNYLQISSLREKAFKTRSNSPARLAVARRGPMMMRPVVPSTTAMSRLRRAPTDHSFDR